MKNELKRTFAQQISERLDTELNLMFGYTSTAQTSEDNTLTAEKISGLVDEWGKLIRNARRNDITFVVEGAHQGPILRHRDPVSGEFFEMSWEQAQALHRQWPIVFVKARDEWTAEFRPACFADTFVPKALPRPPYDVPEEPE